MAGAAAAVAVALLAPASLLWQPPLPFVSTPAHTSAGTVSAASCASHRSMAAQLQQQ
jgi:hypothetical protein